MPLGEILGNWLYFGDFVDKVQFLEKTNFRNSTTSIKAFNEDILEVDGEGHEVVAKRDYTRSNHWEISPRRVHREFNSVWSL